MFLYDILSTLWWGTEKRHRFSLSAHVRGWSYLLTFITPLQAWLTARVRRYLSV